MGGDNDMGVINGDQVTQKFLHPDGQGRKTVSQITTNHLPLFGIGKQALQDALDAGALSVVTKRRLNTIQCLNDQHRRAARPIQTSRRGGLEVNLLTAKFDRPYSCVDQHFNSSWLRCRKSKVVGCRRPVDHEPCLITTCDGLDYCVVAQSGFYVYQPLFARAVVKPPIDTPQLSRGNEPLERLIDRCTTTKISEIAWGPNPKVIGFDLLHQASAQVGGYSVTGNARNFPHGGP